MKIDEHDRSKRSETKPKLRITGEGTMVAVIWRTTLLLGIVGFAAVLLGCEEVLPPEPKKPPVVRPPEPEPTEPEVHVLSRSQLENDVLTVTGNSLLFAQPVSYGKGDFITAEISAKTPHGMLREVTSVSADRQTIMSSDASLEDVLIRGTVTISGTLTPDDLTPASRAALAESGLVARRAEGLGSATAGELLFGYDLSATEGGSKFSGRIDFVLGYELTANYDHGLKDMRFSITPSSVLTVEVSATGYFREEWQLGRELSFLPRKIPRLPFPVYFTPQVELYAGVDGGFDASVMARHTASVTVGAACEEDCGNTESWNDVSESAQLQASGVSFEARTAGQVRIYVAPKLTFNLAGRFGGPYVKALPYLRARAARESGGECLHRALDAGLSGQLGGEARVSVWGKTLVSARLPEFEFAISDPVVLWERRCAAMAAPTSLRATANGAHQIDLSWTAPPVADGVQIVGYKIEVSTDGHTWSVLEGNTNTVATTYSHTGLPAESTRHYRVSAIGSNGTSSEPSNRASATTEQEEPPISEDPAPAMELTSSIAFEGGTIIDGRPPTPTNNSGDPQLSGAPATPSTLAPGDEGTMSIGFSDVPADTPFDVNIRFEGADQYINVPMDPALTGGGTSGTLNLPFSLPDSVCDNLDDIQHQITCYESVSVGGVSVSLEQARQIVLDCGRRQYCDSAGANLAGQDLRNLDLQDCSFAGANLSGANLSGADLSNANLSGANLRYADLSDDSGSGLAAATLSGTDLSNADLGNADLRGVDLTTAGNLSGVKLQSAWLHRANLAGVNLSGENLSWADFPGADLSNANLSGANLRYADLSDDSGSGLAAATLSGTDLSNADLGNADLRGVDLTTAENLSGVKLQSAWLHRANLAGVNLSGENLSWADFPGADLSNANLSGANLRYADLSDDSGSGLAAATLSGTDLSNADLGNADLRGVDLTTAGNLSGVKLQSAWLHRANLAGVNLSGENLSWADFPGADLSNANLSGANLRYADLSDDSGSGLAAATLSGTDLSNADLGNADLRGVDLTTAGNLSGVKLQSAWLHRANLAGVNLSGENLSWADFPGADLSNANLSGANLRYADLSDDSGSGLAAATLSGTDLSNADLSRADLRGVDLTTANLNGVRGCPAYIPSGYENVFDDCT